MPKLLMFSSVSYAGNTAINRIVPVTVQEVHKVTATDTERGYFYLIYFSHNQNNVLIHKLGEDVLVNKAAVDFSGEQADFSIGPYYLNRVNINNNDDFNLSEVIEEDNVLVILYERQAPDIMSLLDFENGGDERIVVNPVSGIIELYNVAGQLAISETGPRNAIQVEHESANSLVLHNQDLRNAVWTKNNVADPIATLDPIGGQTAYQLVASVDNARHSVSQSATVRSLGLFAKRVGYDFAYIRYDTGINIASVICDLTTGTLTEVIESGVSSVIYSRSQPIAWEGFYFEITLNADSTIAEFGICDSNGGVTFAGDGIAYNSIWCPQGNDSTIYCGSPIRTEDSSKTRSADNYSLSAQDFASYGGEAHRFSVWPFGSNNQISDEREIVEFEDFSQNIRCFYDGTDNKVKVQGRRKPISVGSLVDAWGLAKAGNYMYVTTYARRYVWRVNMLTGETISVKTPVEIPSPNRIYGIDSDGTYLYLGYSHGDLSGIWRCDLDGTNDLQLLALSSSPSVNSLYKLRIDATKIYYIDYGVVKSIFSIPIGGGPPTNENIPNATYGLALDATNIYADAGTTIVYRAKSGGIINTLVTGIAGGVGGIWVDGDYIYFTEKSTGEIFYAPLATGTPKTKLTPFPAAGNPFLQDIIVDGNTVWYAQSLTVGSATKGLWAVWKGAIETPATTHSQLQQLLVTLDPTIGNLEIDNFSSGNGDVTGRPWDVTAGKVFVGMDKDALHQWDGIVHFSKIR